VPDESRALVDEDGRGIPIPEAGLRDKPFYTKSIITS
jgi:hypothetical protein